MEISKDLVKELREKTNAGIMDCKRALAEAQGEFSKALQILNKKGAAVAQKKAQRTTAEGSIVSYIHMGGKIGVLLEINCETDFVARNKIFQELAKDVALQIAGAHPVPLFVSKDKIALEIVERLTKEFQEEYKDKKPEAVQKIVEGKLAKYFQETCLMEQPFIKNPDITISQLIQSKIAELGENIVVRRFVRYQVGETAGAA